jgi:hypothetical protein
MNGSIRRAIWSLALACAAATTLVGGAQAGHPDDRAGTHGVSSAVAATDLIDRVLLRQKLTAHRPDDRAGAHGVAPIKSESLAAASYVVDSGFHWDDAGIGAATALGLALATGAGVAALRRRRPVLH